MKKLVIVGCGKLGNIVVDALLKGLLSEYALVGDGFKKSEAGGHTLAQKIRTGSAGA